MSFFGNFVITILYILLASAVGVKEYKRMKRYGFNILTLVMAFIFIYAILPSIVIHSILGAHDSNIVTNIYFFDKVILNINIVDSLTVFFLLTIFIIGLYISTEKINYETNKIRFIKLHIREGVALIICFALFLICVKFFIDLGSNFSERYTKLILFRSLDLESERTFFSANAFAITQTLTWLSAAMLYISFSKGKISLSVIYTTLMIAGIVLMGSRRAIIFAVLIIYFSFTFEKKKLNLTKIIWFMPLFIFWLAFGKELSSAIAYDQRTDNVFNQYSSISALILRSFCDIGITQISSYAVLQHFDFNIRFGIDHILSLLRRLPDGILGLDIQWPERIVRITTEAFTSRDDADIAPGLIGQSWFDFPVLGALFWGLIIGFQVYILNKFSNKIISCPEKSALIVLISMIISLPINTGSYDFTFSIDIIVLSIILFFIFDVKMNNKKIERGP